MDLKKAVSLIPPVPTQTRIMQGTRVSTACTVNNELLLNIMLCKKCKVRNFDVTR